MSSPSLPPRPARRRLTRRVLWAATSAVSMMLPHQGYPGPTGHPAPLQLAYAPEHSPDQALQKFFGAGYSYCDALVLADFWGESDAYDAKLRLGDGMLRRGPEDAGPILDQARAQALAKAAKDEWLCHWSEDGGYGFEDVELLASYWGEESPWDAKLTIQRFLIQGRDFKVQADLTEARAAEPGIHRMDSGYVPENQADRAAEKFYLEGYSYCDAKVLAAFWGEESPYDAKVRLGDKMLSFGPDVAQSHLPPARAQAASLPEDQQPCWYDDGGYSYEDAELLASYWGQPGVFEAKLKMTSLLVAGQNQDIQSDLEAARARRQDSAQDGG